MVGHPREYHWSSYSVHAAGVSGAVTSIHALYRSLGKTAIERQRAYRALFRSALDTCFVEALRAATNGGWALGNDRFKQRVAKALERRVVQLPRGRPRKAAVDPRQLNLLD